MESAGPVWSLIGVPKRAGLRHNTITLKRGVDALSPRIKRAIGQLLPAVQITDRSGISATLLHVRINSIIPPRGSYTPKLGGEQTEHDTDEQEDFNFTFQAISLVNSSGSSSTSDDWTHWTQGGK